MHNDMFRKLNVFSHTVYHSDDGYMIWEDGKRQKKLYAVIPINDDEFDVFSGDDIPLGNSLKADKVVSFIEADLGIGSPIPDSEIVTMKKIDEVHVDIDEEDMSKTERIIATAAKKHGYESAGSSLLQDLAARRKMNKGLQGTVKKKRKINLDDLDLDDDEVF